MALQFNDPSMNIGTYVTFPEEGTGKNIDQMSKLLADNRHPLTFAGSMKLKLRALDLYASVLENPTKYTLEYKVEVTKFFKDVWSNYIDTGDAIFLHPGRRARINLVNPQNARDSEFLKLFDPKNKEKLKQGAIVLPDGMYDSEIGIREFNAAEMETFTNKHYAGEKGVLENRIWKVLARNPSEVPRELAEDSELLKTFTKAVNYLSVFTFGYTENMGVDTAYPQDVETGRLWFAGRLWGRSGAYGRDHWDPTDGRLVGVALDAPRLVVPSYGRLEEIIAKLTPHQVEIKQLLVP